MSDRIAQAFATAKSGGRTALIPYAMAGYPSVEESVAIANSLIEGGADILEVGMPFSDPLADGPTIQRVGTASLRAGTTTSDCLEVVRQIRASHQTPLVLMGYFNPIFQYGIERFCDDAVAAGADGLIVADLPPEECGELHNAATAAGLHLIFLLAPTSTDERIAHVAELASGFIYCVSLVGITGARTNVSTSLPEFVTRVRARTDLPLAVGFGIATAEHVRSVGKVADGAVVASALIDHTDAVAKLGTDNRATASRDFISALQS